MSFFKGLQWFEWLFIGVVVAMLGAGYILWNKYEDKTEQLGGAKVVNEVLTETVKYKDASATITDAVVTEFVQSDNDAKVELEQSRKGVIDEYINMATGTAEPPAPVVPEKVAPPPKVVPSADKVRPTPVGTNVTGADARIDALAERMQQHYCKAAPERGLNCSTDNPH